jgi:mono/diheme cytochrome c family protein
MTPSRLLAGLGFMVVVAITGAAQQEKPAAARPPADSSRTSTVKGNAEHGRYIVEHIAMCFECHSPRDESGEIVRDQRFMGAPIPFRPPWPNDWAQRAPRNAGLPGYTDEQALRLLTEGAIARDGRQLRPPMPRFRMTVEDARDVVAFMRSLH